MGRLRKDKGSSKIRVVEPRKTKSNKPNPKTTPASTDVPEEDPKLQAEVKNLLQSLQKGGGNDANDDDGGAGAKMTEGRRPRTTPHSKATSKSAGSTLLVSKSSSGLDLPQAREWWTLASPLTASQSTTNNNISPTQFSNLLSKSSALLPSTPQTKETEFMTQIISSGTLSDRLSALTLLIQSSPIHNIRGLEMLKGMAEGKKRDEGLKAMRCIVDWWTSSGCPDRKLRYFRDQPALLHPDATNVHHAVWFFEDWLKKYFFSVLQILETLTHDPLPYVRTQAYSFIFTLLKSKPEQEQNLLRLGVSGLSDGTKPIPSKTTEHLLELLQLHPGMREVVLGEICERILKVASPSSIAAPLVEEGKSHKHIRFSPPPASIGDEKKKPPPPAATLDSLPRGTLPALQMLTQLVLSSATEKDRQVAQKLIKVYLQMFSILVPVHRYGHHDQDEEEKEKGEEEEVKKDKKGRILQSRSKSKKNRETKAPEDILGGEETGKVLSTILTGINRAMPFAFGVGGEWDELIPLTDPLFHLISSPKVAFNVSLQSLMLLERIVESLSRTSDKSGATEKKKGKTNKGNDAKALKKRYYRALYHLLQDVDGRLGSSGKDVLFLNVLGRSAKALVLLVVGTREGDASGGNDEEKRKKSWRERKNKKNNRSKAQESPEPPPVGAEIPIPEGEGEEDFERLCSIVHRFIQLLVSGSKSCNPEFVEGGLVLIDKWFSLCPPLRARMLSSPSPSLPSEKYDSTKREPEFSHASGQALWELMPLLSHYHPTISLHASQLVAGTPLSGASTDMGLNTVSHFLDRFVFKNPKKIQRGKKGDEGERKRKGASYMQPLEGELGDGVEKRLRRVKGEQREGLGTGWEEGGVGEEYLRKWEEGRKRKEKKQERDEDDVEEGEGDAKDEDEDEEAEEEIWKAMKASMPGPAISDEDEDADLDDDLDNESLLDHLSGGSDEDDDEVQVDDDGESEDEDIEDDEEGEDEDALASDSDASELLPFDGLIAYPSSAPDSDVETEEWGGIGHENDTKKRKRDEGGSGSRSKKKLKGLPTFASYEDYQKMIEEGPEDLI